MVHLQSKEQSMANPLTREIIAEMVVQEGGAMTMCTLTQRLSKLGYRFSSPDSLKKELKRLSLPTEWKLSVVLNEFIE
jgi:hypothetical protein